MVSTARPPTLRSWLAVAAGRLTRILLRLAGRSATAAPGKVALFVDGTLLQRLVNGRRLLLVTGTNGKTTTVRMLCRMLETQGFAVVTNASGANMASGLTTALLTRQARLMLKRDPVLLVFEIDEAYFGKLAGSLQAETVVVTNIFQDQVDRFTDVYALRDLIANGLAASQSCLITCADDPLCVSLGQQQKGRLLTFGLKADRFTSCDPDRPSEVPFCPRCGSRLTCQATSYGHLGAFTCLACGFARPEPDLHFHTTDETQAQMTLTVQKGSERAATTLSLPGLHNAYNAAGALLAAVQTGLPLHPSLRALAGLDAAAGRMERWTIQDRQVCLILVKNAIGLQQAFALMHQASDLGALMLVINAQEADGRDVSWLWDAHLETHLPDGPVGVSGERLADVALRLHYAGLKTDQIQTGQDPLVVFENLLAACPQTKSLYLLANYSAMRALRRGLTRRHGLKGGP